MASSDKTGHCSELLWTILVETALYGSEKISFKPSFG